MAADYTPGDPIPRRLEQRHVGESNRDCIARLAGMLRAAELDNDRLRALLGSATPAPPATLPEFPTNDDRICANTIAEALTKRYGAVLFSLRYQMARHAMDVCGEWTAAADAREAAGIAARARCDSDDINECSCNSQNVEEDR